MAHDPHEFQHIPNLHSFINKHTWKWHYTIMPHDYGSKFPPSASSSSMGPPTSLAQTPASEGASGNLTQWAHKLMNGVSYVYIIYMYIYVYIYMYNSLAEANRQWKSLTRTTTLYVIYIYTYNTYSKPARIHWSGWHLIQVQSRTWSPTFESESRRPQNSGRIAPVIYGYYMVIIWLLYG